MVEETFLAEMRNDLAIRVPVKVRDRLGIQRGKLLRVTIRIEED
jgi:bifunctional DNA-binding transcriptional regulator/antitoxin component of YhaV-PrlF toxin-antitoxin module